MLLHFPFDDHFDDVTCNHAKTTKYGPGQVTLVWDDERNSTVASFDGRARLEVRLATPTPAVLNHPNKNVTLYLQRWRFISLYCCTAVSLYVVKSAYFISTPNHVFSTINSDTFCSVVFMGDHCARPYLANFPPLFSYVIDDYFRNIVNEWVTKLAHSPHHPDPHLASPLCGILDTPQDMLQTLIHSLVQLSNENRCTFLLTN